MTNYEVLKNIMNSNKIGEEDKVYYIHCFLLHCFTVEQIKWIWEG